MARELIATFDGGKVTIETKGFQGTDCIKETAAIEKALGIVTSDTKTREYHEVPRVSQKQGQR